MKRTTEKSVILLEEISSSQADTESIFELLFFVSFLTPPKKFAGERGIKCPVEEPGRPVEDVCETEAGTDADIKDKVFDVVGGMDIFGVAGYV